MDINKSTRLFHDNDSVRCNTDDSNKISEYLLNNFRDIKGMAQATELSLTRPDVHITTKSRNRDNTGACMPSQLTNLNQLNMIQPRSLNTIPLMSRSGCDITADSKLKFTENTQMGKEKSSSSIDRFFTQVEKVRSKQYTRHIIPEDSDSEWVRGGVSSRLIVKDEDYKRRLGDKK